MTQIRRCAWCGTRFATAGGPGRPARYCRRSHRQRHYEARREAERLGLDGVVVTGAGWAALRDAAYRLEAALEDALLDAADGDPEAALEDLGTAVRELLGLLPDPIAVR